jgi:hypothetical protein
LTINITQANTAALEQETAQFHQVSAAGLNAIGQYLQADLGTTGYGTDSCKNGPHLLKAL